MNFRYTLSKLLPDWMVRAWREGFGKSYKAGSHNNNSLGWAPYNGKAEQVNTPARKLIRAKARDLERNSDILGSILVAFENNVVGTGFKLRMRTKDEETNTAIEQLFEEWCKPKNCDITGCQSFNELCTMAVRRMRVDGGILFLKCNTGSKRFPFQLQAKEVDDIDESYTKITPETQYIVNGIEVNRYQKPLAYYLLSTDPNGWQTPISERVEADRVIALWEKTMPSQIREMSPAAPTIERINDMEDYLDTIGIKEKILACISAFIKRQNPQGGLGRSITRVPPNGKDYDPATGYTRSRLTPGMIMELQPGDDVSAVVPGGQASNARELVTMYIRSIGSGQGLSYETTSRDMSQVNYSSARQGLIADNQAYKRLQRFFIEHFLNEVFESFLDSVILAGTLTLKDYWSNRNAYITACDWSTPGQPWIDPVKEANANKIAIETGQETLSSVCANQGRDWRDVLRQRAQELAYQKQLEEEFEINMKGGEENGKSTNIGTTESESRDQRSGTDSGEP